MIVGDEPEVYVTAQTQEQVSPGSEFIVRMTIHKGKTLGFARIQQFLPDGFSADVLDSRMAQFIDDGQSIKFIWTQMPAEESFEISYRVSTTSTMQGLQVINGVLIYIEDDKTEQYALPPIEILVSDGAALVNEPGKPKVERKLIATVPELNEYKVELTIYPNAEEKSARFIDQIPEGYEAFADQTHGAHFLFAEGVVKFSWTKMPVDPVFTISYLVRSAQRKTPPSINGMLVYGNSAMDMELDSIDKNDELYEQALKTTDESANHIVHELLASENSNKVETSVDTEASISETMIPTAKPGISYKVQISATIKSPARDNSWFQKNYKMTEAVDLTYHEGWKKYLIGSFDNFQEANLHKRKTRQKVNDAFVVAYQDGQRISLQQAIDAKNISQ
jgi:hypothetical protein